jgi:Zn-dependent protease
MRRRLPDLATLWLGTTLSYALLQAGVHLRRADALAALERAVLLLPANLATAGVACGLALALRELARQRAACRAGLSAEARAPAAWVLVAALVCLAGWFALAPTVAVYRGAATPRECGRVALAAPAASLAQSLAWFGFLAVIVVGRVAMPPWVAAMGYAGFLINAWLALTAAVPFGPFDGAAILAWSRAAWAAVAAAGLALACGLTNETVLQALLRLVTRGW